MFVSDGGPAQGGTAPQASGAVTPLAIVAALASRSSSPGSRQTPALATARRAVERRLGPLLRTRYWAALRRSLDSGITDGAASLTYYVLLSMVPCITLIVAIVGLLGRDPETTNAILEVIQKGASANAADTLRSGLQSALESAPKSGTFLGIGLIATLYVASLYVSAFARAAKALAGEGRHSDLRSRPLQALATFAGIIILALALLAVAISRRIADALAGVTGLGLFANDLWPFIKWGFVLVSLIVIVSGLYSLDPTRPQRWPLRPTRGGLVAVGLWVAATVGFEVYLGTIASYDQTYGALGGIVTFLVWAWLSNIVLLYGVALDQEYREGATSGGRAADRVQPTRE